MAVFGTILGRLVLTLRPTGVHGHTVAKTTSTRGSAGPNVCTVLHLNYSRLSGAI